MVLKKDKLGNPYLCAYVVPDTQRDVRKIIDRLLEKLPEYMIPAHFVNKINKHKTSHTDESDAEYSQTLKELENFQERIMQGD